MNSNKREIAAEDTAEASLKCLGCIHAAQNAVATNSVLKNAWKYSTKLARGKIKEWYAEN